MRGSDRDRERELAYRIIYICIRIVRGDACRLTNNSVIIGGHCEGNEEASPYLCDTRQGPLNNQTGALPKCILCEENILEAS